MALRIKVQGETLDLFPRSEESFYLTFQVFDLASLESREATFSRQLVIPNTPTNNRIFGFPRESVSSGGQAYSRLPCTVEIDGIPIVESGEILFAKSGDENTFEAAVFAGNFGFFNSLPNTPLTDLDFSDLSFAVDLTNITALMRPWNGTFTVTAIANRSGDSTLTISPTTSVIQVNDLVYLRAAEADALNYVPGFYKVLAIDSGTQIGVEVPFTAALTEDAELLSPIDAGLITPYADYFTEDSQEVVETTTATSPYIIELGIYNIKLAGFQIMIRELLRRLILRVGYVPDFSEIDFSEFDTHGLLCAYDQFLAVITGATAAAGQVGKSAQQIFTPPAELRCTFDTVISVNNITFNNAQDQFEITQDGQYNVRFNGAYVLTRDSQSNGPSVLRIRKNSAVIATLNLPTFSTSDFFNIQVFGVSAVVGDTLYCTVDPAQRNSPVTLGDQVTITNITQFEAEEVGVVSNTVNPTQYLPRVSQREFFKAAAQHFGLIVSTNPFTRVVKLSPFKNIFSGQKLDDLSDLIQFSDNPDPEFENSIGAYGQQNFFLYNKDNLKRTDVDGSWNSDNATLPLEGLSLQSLFYASDTSTLLGNVEKIRLPVFDYAINLETGVFVQCTNGAAFFDFYDANTGGNLVDVDARVGDYLKAGPVYIAQITDIQNNGTRILTTSVFTGASTRFATPGIVSFSGELKSEQARICDSVAETGENIWDGEKDSAAGGRIAIPTTYQARFGDNLLWPSIINSRYSEILGTLNKVQLYKKWAFVPVAAILGLDFTKLYYVKEYDSYFYINKVEQWKSTTLTRLEIIRVPFTPLTV